MVEAEQRFFHKNKTKKKIGEKCGSRLIEKWVPCSNVHRGTLVETHLVAGQPSRLFALSMLLLCRLVASSSTI